MDTKKIYNDARYVSFFKVQIFDLIFELNTIVTLKLFNVSRDCIRAIDGTYVDACVPNSEKATYVERCGSSIENILSVCDFNI